MKYVHYLFFALLTICAVSAAVLPAKAQEMMRTFPVPQTVSPELQALIKAKPIFKEDVHPQNAQEWKTLRKALSSGATNELAKLRAQLNVTVTQEKLGGVPVFILTPKDLPEKNRDRILLNLHGGGYVFGAGESGTKEATLMAGIGKFRVVYVDYRMAPDFPYPAAIDDAMAVYRELLKTTPAEKIGVFGTSTGGGMTLILALRAKAEKVALPAALAAGTPWADLSKTGDSYFTNEGVDNVLVSYDGWVGAAAQLYADGHDLKDPMLSPVYGDVHDFPPTLLTSGTRDLFLSNTVRMHLKLREAGVPADLIIFEGMSHAQYHMNAKAPETKFHFSELQRFFEKYLK